MKAKKEQVTPMAQTKNAPAKLIKVNASNVWPTLRPVPIEQGLFFLSVSSRIAWLSSPAWCNNNNLIFFQLIVIYTFLLLDIERDW